MDTEKIINPTQQIANRNRATKTNAKEEEEWLRAIVPALKGPFAGNAWIKHVLRPIVEAGYTA